MFGGKARNYTTIDSCKMRFPQVKLKTIKEALPGDTSDYHKNNTNNSNEKKIFPSFFNKSKNMLSS